MDITKATPKETGDMLKSRGVKPSVIRIRVMQYLLANRIHPNAETIYKALLREIPTLSKTSIYNTLKTLSSNGLVLEIMAKNGEVRFDGYPERHAHFMCTSCGMIRDVELKCASCRTTGLQDCKVENETVYFKGLCAECSGAPEVNAKKKGKKK
jgi:Fur family transcriptional regulator, peroxide stress response regulator